MQQEDLEIRPSLDPTRGGGTGTGGPKGVPTGSHRTWP